MASATPTVQEAQPNRLPRNLPIARRSATDDEILGIGDGRAASALPAEEQAEFRWDANGSNPDSKTTKSTESQEGTGSELKAVLDANPALRSAWDDAAEYRKAFATPDDARAASTRLADLDRLDALFFSGRPEDHAELARAVAALDPASFNSLAAAMAQLASARQVAAPNRAAINDVGALDRAQAAGKAENSATTSVNSDAKRADATSSENAALTPAQTQFFHSVNAAAVEEVLRAIENQVEKVLPEEISKSARNRVVGEIYRELDSTLQSNGQLAQQMRDAFRSGALDSEHRRAIVSLLTARARQALPAVAKRVLNEWTSTIVAANQDRRARQRTAERRVDIAGSGRMGSEARRPTSPRDIDYARMSDSDILNL